MALIWFLFSTRTSHRKLLPVCCRIVFMNSRHRCLTKCLTCFSFMQTASVSGGKTTLRSTHGAAATNQRGTLPTVRCRCVAAHKLHLRTLCFLSGRHLLLSCGIRCTTWLFGTEDVKQPASADNDPVFVAFANSLHSSMLSSLVTGQLPQGTWCCVFCLFCHNLVTVLV